ncbi:MAG: 2-oxo acid dehydrogenase subunit E2 [Virgibacillus proomii]|jgi:pyruvate dehydrogenase E2 component (dihydrolipoamide acetyltransferase)
MATTIVMPKLGMTMTEGTIEEWLKKPGDAVEQGEGIATISSDKLTSEVEAPEAGVLLNITKEVGEKIPVGEVIGFVGHEGEEVSETASTLLEEKEEKPEALSQQAAPKETVDPLMNQKQDGPNRKRRISPAARKKAKELDINIATIEGTGPKGRITRRDVERAVEQKELAVTKEQVEETVVERPIKTSNMKGLSAMRKSIAINMQESLANTAQLTLHRKADITELIAFQKKLREEADQNNIEIKLTITVFLARAVTLSLLDHPEVNTHLIDDMLQQYEAVHLGIATSLDNGLVVPVVKHAERLPLGSLARQIQGVTEAARAGENVEMSGSTFTITNLGAHGIEYFTPILNPPESGILGVGTFMKEMELDEHEKLQTMIKLPLSLTFDHRVLDGSPAAVFLRKIVYYLENPYLLLL